MLCYTTTHALTNANFKREHYNQQVMLHPSALRTVFINGFVNNYLTEIYLFRELAVIKHALKCFNVYRLYDNSLAL